MFLGEEYMGLSGGSWCVDLANILAFGLSSRHYSRKGGWTYYGLRALHLSPRHGPAHLHMFFSPKRQMGIRCATWHSDPTCAFR